MAIQLERMIRGLAFRVYSYHTVLVYFVNFHIGHLLMCSVESLTEVMSG